MRIGPLNLTTWSNIRTLGYFPSISPDSETSGSEPEDWCQAATMTLWMAHLETTESLGKSTSERFYHSQQRFSLILAKDNMKKRHVPTKARHFSLEKVWTLTLIHNNHMKRHASLKLFYSPSFSTWREHSKTISGALLSTRYSQDSHLLTISASVCTPPIFLLLLILFSDFGDTHCQSAKRCGWGWLIREFVTRTTVAPFWCSIECKPVKTSLLCHQYW